MTTETQEPTARAAWPLSDVEAVASALAASPRVVVLGGGVAGLTAAHELRRRLGDHAAITLIGESEQFLLGPALLWVPFGRRTHTIGFPIAPALKKRNITFVHARAEHIDPERRVVLAHYKEIPYDYLLIATGPRADGTAIPGVSGQFNATTSIWSEREATEAHHALERFLERPGPVVVGAAQGAAYLSAAYEFALLLDYELRRRGKRDQAPITFVTPEPYIGHLDIGALAARRVLERLLARRGITALANTAIERVDREGVHLQGGRKLPAAYTMIIPPFSGVTGIWKSAGLSDAHGFVPVNTLYRHNHYAGIYAVGVAAQPAVASPALAGLPKTGYLATVMARAAAQNLAAAITGRAPARRSLPRLLDLRLIDGGDGGVLLLTAELGRPLHLALPLPGRTAHRAKALLVRYLLWKLRTSRTALP